MEHLLLTYKRLFNFTLVLLAFLEVIQSRNLPAEQGKSQKNVLDKIDAIHERLDKVMIENRDFKTLITQYDFEDAFFYLL
ncbi:hypothetical protein [Campylobacter cuniculorum]|uniref:hypothetical protein n=1 Tax=Campylobacter cuniculorum TaxID=374106 RepID=UPI0023F0F789|nr:hypothetical protein [Campylobacter cuniculorum]